MDRERFAIRRLSLSVTVLSALTLAMLAATFLFWPSVRDWQEHRLALRLVEKLQSDAEADGRAVLRQIASLGTPAIESLIIVAAGEHIENALTARQIIEEQMAIWRSRRSDPNFSLSGPTCELAAALAGHIEEFGQGGRQWSVQLSLALVELAEELAPANAALVLADCNTVFDVVAPVGPIVKTPINPRKQSNQIAADVPLPEISLPAFPSEYAVVAAREHESISDFELGEESLAAVDANPEIAQSTQLPRASNWIPEWDQTPAKPNIENREQLPGGQAETQHSEKAVDLPSPEEMAKLIEELNVHETRELIERLATVDHFQAGAIRVVLTQRGIGREEFVIAQKLYAPDPSERLQLVGDLQILPASIARRWLRELLADENADVRLRALTALATTNDPELVGIAREVAVNDRDARVTELASRIIRTSR